MVARRQLRRQKDGPDAYDLVRGIRPEEFEPKLNLRSREKAAPPSGGVR